MTLSRLWARCIRGLEEFVAEEVLDRLDADAAIVGHREVEFGTEDLARAITLRTVDDLFLLAGDISGIGRARASVSRLSAETPSLPIAQLVAQRAAHVESPPVNALGVTASFLGQRNFNRFDLEDSVGSALSEVLAIPYNSRRHGRGGTQELEWRVHVVDDRARIGLRLGKVPLHRRGYKRVAPLGTTHPPVAAAMVRLPSLHDGDLVWDPTCGAGTIPIEAALLNGDLRVGGSDVNPTMAAAAAQNARSAEVRCEVLCADAARLPIRDSSLDAVIANLPWGRQAPVHAQLAVSPHGALVEARRVLRDGGWLVLLAEGPLLATDGLELMRERELSLMGAHPALRAWRAI